MENHALTGSVVLEGSEFMDPLTVEGLFAEIERDLDLGVASIAATFDPVLGYPTGASVDRARHIADEEWGFDKVSLEPR